MHELVRVTKLFKEAMEDMSEDAEYSIQTLDYYMNVNEIRLYCCYIYCAKVNNPSSMLCIAIKELNGIYKQTNYKDAIYCLS